MKRWTEINWDIRREGHPWSGDEFRAKYYMAPEKIEAIEGRLFWNDDERMRMLGLLLENLGIDKAIRLGDPRLWREAIAELEDKR